MPSQLCLRSAKTLFGFPAHNKDFNQRNARRQRRKRRRRRKEEEEENEKPTAKSVPNLGTASRLSSPILSIKKKCLVPCHHQKWDKNIKIGPAAAGAQWDGMG